MHQALGQVLETQSQSNNKTTVYNHDIYGGSFERFCSTRKIEKLRLWKTRPFVLGHEAQSTVCGQRATVQEWAGLVPNPQVETATRCMLSPHSILPSETAVLPPGSEGRGPGNSSSFSCCSPTREMAAICLGETAGGPREGCPCSQLTLCCQVNLYVTCLLLEVIMPLLRHGTL